jgi:hypothetical protein
MAMANAKTFRANYTDIHTRERIEFDFDYDGMICAPADYISHSKREIKGIHVPLTCNWCFALTTKQFNAIH